jgi:CelD/BcsL family acetyltransferase involved in cellulose biosynthesis
LQVRAIDPLADTPWLSFIEGTPDASVFCHPAWLAVLRDTYGYRPICLMAGEAERPLGILPLMEVRSWLTGTRAVCLPYSDACGPLTRDEAALPALLTFADELRKERHWRYVEIRDSVVRDGFRTTARYKRHLTDLDRDPDAQLKTFNQHARRKLRQADATGVRVERRIDDAALQAFIRLNALTRRRHGVLPQPDSLFCHIQQRLLGEGLGFIALASLDNAFVAAGLFLTWKGTVLYKYGASDKRGAAAAANYAVMWNAMRWGCEQGYRRFDFGRTDLAGEGLLQFKRGWGSRELDLVYVQRRERALHAASETHSLQERLKPLISRMPVGVLKFIGRRAYPHAG